MGDFASKGVAGTGLGLGIAGTALGLLNNGGLGGLFGGNNNAYNNATLDYISKLQSEVGRLSAEKYADHIGKEVYGQSLLDNRDLRKETKTVTDELIRAVAELQSEIRCMRADVARNTGRIDNITKEIVPLSAICPEPMPRYNIWTEPKAPAEGTRSR